MEGINTDIKTPERLINKNEDIKEVAIPQTKKSGEEQVADISNQINKEEQTISSTKNSIENIRQSLGLTGEETNIPSIESNKNNKSKLEKTLNLITSNVSSFAKVSAVSAGLFVGSNNLEASNNKQNQKDKFIQGTEGSVNIEEDNSKVINGGSIEEVVVYDKKKYQEELTKQEENIKKFEAEMAKYQKDSIEWVKANEAYQDSLFLYNKSFSDYNNLIKNIPNLKGSLNNILTGDEVLSSIQSSLELEDQKDPNVYYDGNVKEAKNNQWNKGSKLQGFSNIGDNSELTAEHKPVIDFIEEKKSEDIKPKYIPLVPTWGNYNNEIDKKWAWYSPIYDKPKGSINSIPYKPELQATKEIKYDPKFEDLNMRSLWATILKQNPNAKIGTLHALDKEFKEGFTLEEAMTFPQEIKDQYNIDYIYNQIHGAEKPAITQDYIHPGWDYNGPIDKKP